MVTSAPAQLPFSLHAIEEAFERSYSFDICSEDDRPFWSEDNRSRGHCVLAALTLNDLFGGDLLVAEVLRDGEKVGYHYWNRLAGLEVDLTRDQFLPNEEVGEPDLVARPRRMPGNYAEEYETFRDRVFAELGVS